MNKFFKDFSQRRKDGFQLKANPHRMSFGTCHQSLDTQATNKHKQNTQIEGGKTCAYMNVYVYIHKHTVKAAFIVQT